MNILRKTLCLSLLILFATCKNDDDTPPIEQLPEATQTGRGIFGCLVDGEAFVETGTFFNTFYQFVDGGFFFGIQGQFEGRSPSSVTMGVRDVEINEGDVIPLLEMIDGQAWGGAQFVESSSNFQLAKTNTIQTGTLTITKFNLDTNIVSGTFEMTLIHPFTGEEVQITEGRFDTLFTQ